MNKIISVRHIFCLLVSLSGCEKGFLVKKTILLDRFENIVNIELVFVLIFIEFVNHTN